MVETHVTLRRHRRDRAAVARRRAVVLGAAVAGAALCARGRLMQWGSTREERDRPLPGDGAIPGEQSATTMATTIAAPPPAIWPWLAQMGADRGGWYSWDRLDNGGRPSAESINPAWQDVAEGDRFTTIAGRSWFDVAHVEPGRSLVLRAPLDAKGRPFDLRGPRPRSYSISRWEFFLDPRPDGTTRLLVRSGGVTRPRSLGGLANRILWDPVHVFMQRRQFRQLRRRAEAPGTGAGCAATSRPSSPR
jgi:hypothetical protein